jgi:hypothetical protein
MPESVKYGLSTCSVLHLFILNLEASMARQSGKIKRSPALRAACPAGRADCPVPEQRRR